MTTSKTIRSFNAESEVNDLINEAGIPKGKMSDWINDKIKKGFLYDRTHDEKITIPLRAKGKIIGVKIR